jgi:hypothetical protein
VAGFDAAQTAWLAGRTGDFNHRSSITPPDRANRLVGPAAGDSFDDYPANHGPHPRSAAPVWQDGML